VRSGVLFIERRSVFAEGIPGVKDENGSESDSAFIAQAKEDPEAFGLLYERYVDQIYRYVYYRTGNHKDAEDLTAKTFYRALKSLPRYEDRGAPFAAWLYRIAHNAVANWHRNRSRHPMVALDAIAPPSEDRPSPQRLIEAGEEQDFLLEAVRRLNPDRQELLILKFVEGMTNAEIGDVMGRTEGAIKSLYHRTLVALRKDFNVD
jgi:RNA polymerase sigma-70 factor (ECF subfamily)